MKKLTELSLDEKIGQLILPGFPSKEIDEHIETLVKDYKIGNVLLFSRNFENGDQLFKLNKDLHDLIVKETGIIPFIAIDQEGGLVFRLTRDASFAAGNMTCAASYPGAVYQNAKIIAEDMIKLGMNLNLAPVVDVNNNPLNPVINVRSFSSSKDVVATLAHEYKRGLDEFGVLGTAKHFPGHGDATVDSHLGLPVSEHSKERLYDIEMYPFKQNIDMPCIMSAHMVFKAFDENPATLSKTLLKDVLRGEFGYKGIIISDCLEMKAIADRYGSARGALLALEAGCDMVDISHTLDTQIEAIKLIKEAILNGEFSIEELDEKVARILNYKEATYKYLEKYFYNVNHYNKNEANDLIVQDIVDSSFTLIKGDLPKVDSDTLVIAPIGLARTIIEDVFEDRNVGLAIKDAYPNTEVVIYQKEEAVINEILAKAKNAKDILFISYNAATDKIQQKLINDLIDINPSLSVISLKGPFDEGFYPNLKNYSCLYEYTAHSIKTLIKILQRKIACKGHLPA